MHSLKYFYFIYYYLSDLNTDKLTLLVAYVIARRALWRLTPCMTSHIFRGPYNLECIASGQYTCVDWFSTDLSHAAEL